MNTPQISKISHQGGIELALILPLFAFLAWGCAYLSWIQFQTSRLERAAWYHSLSHSMGNPPKTSKEKAQTLFPKTSTGQQRLLFSKRSGTVERLAEVASYMMAENLPLSFRSFLLLHRSKLKKICASSKSHSIFQKPMSNQNCGESGSSIFHQSIDQTLPGSNFKNHFAFANTIWGEAMIKAGFSYPVLKALAIPEMSKIGLAMLTGPSGSGAISLAASPAISWAEKRFSDLSLQKITNEIDKVLQKELQNTVDKKLQGFESQILEKLKQQWAHHDQYSNHP